MPFRSRCRNSKPACATQKALTPDFPVIVKGDSTVQYQKVMDVLDLLRRLDLPHVGLVTGKQQQG